MKLGAMRLPGAKRGDPYVLSYRTVTGAQVLMDENAQPVTFSKRDLHAANYGANNEARRVIDAMDRPFWSDLLIDFPGQ